VHSPTPSPVLDLHDYQTAVREEFAKLKETSTFVDLQARKIPLDGQFGHLLPVCRLNARDNETIRLLAKWRDENSFAFPTRFPVTIEGTAHWVHTKILAVPDRLLFLIVDGSETPVGQIGFVNALNEQMEMEVENVVRGEKHVSPGIMGWAIHALLAWADETFSPRGYWLRVLRDNEHAICFYRKMGFCEERLIPLRRHKEGDHLAYLPLDDADLAEPDKYFVRMIFMRMGGN